MSDLKIISLNNPKSPEAEAFRTLRTNIQFSSFDRDIQAIVVTSSGPTEGKTTISSNLGCVMAQNGRKTLVIDCDLRKPRLHKIFNISGEVGLSNYLINEASLEEAIHKTEIENLFVLPAGVKPPNPSELLESRKMKTFIEKLKDEFEFIVIDTPPVLAVTDAQVVSRYADGCILVVASRQTERDGAIKAKELIEKVNAKILGVVLNKTESSKKGYYRYYTYYYGSDGKKHSKKRTVKG